MAVTTVLLGVGLIVFGVLLIYVLLSVWPTVERITAAGTGTSSPSTTSTTQAGTSAEAAVQGSEPAAVATDTIELFGVRLLTVDPETALLLLVVTSSALGSYIHAATSFATYVGNQRFTMSWTWWYLLRVFIGAALAVLFYFVVRGGLLSAQAESGAVNPYGVAGLAGLVGLFSKQATDKLREVFESLFRTAEGQGDDERKDKLTYPVPKALEVEPSPIPPGASIRLRLEGTGFTPDSKVRIRRLGEDVDPLEVVPASVEPVSDTQMAVSLNAADLQPAAELEFVVVNPAPGGGESDPVRVPVGALPAPTAAAAPAPETPRRGIWAALRAAARAMRLAGKRR